MPENFTPEQQHLIELDSQQMARFNYAQAQGMDAQYYADAKRLAQASGQPIDSVLRDPKPAQRQQAMDSVDWENLAKVAPSTAQMMTDMDKAKLIGTALPEFSKTEGAWEAIKNSANENLFTPVMRGIKGAYSNLLIADRFDPFLGWENTSKYNEFHKWQMRRQFAKQQAGIERDLDALPLSADIQRGLSEIDQAKTFGEAAGAIARNPKAVAETTIESFLTSAPTMAMTMATGGMGKLPTALTTGYGSYSTEYASTIKDVLGENGVNLQDEKAVREAYNDPHLMAIAKTKATLRGIPVGAFDGLTAYFAGSWLAGAKNTATSKLYRTFMEFAAQASGGAAGEKSAQIATGENNPGAVLMEAAAEVPSGIVEAKANYHESGLAAREAQFKAETAAKATEQAKNHKAQLDKLAEMAKADQVLQRAPELVQEMVQNATQDSGASHIYISANDLHQSGMAVDVAAVSPTVAAEIRQATAENGLIAIPAAEYATRIAPQQWADKFNDHIRETPEAYSAAESANIIKENGAQLKGEFDAAMRQISDSEAFSQSATTVKENILGQLKQLGVHSDAVNDGYATAFAAYYATRAKQLGETPEAFAARRPLKWQAQRPDGSGVVANEYPQALAAQPPKGWVHSTTGQDAAAMWRGEQTAQAVFWTDLDGKLQTDAPELVGYSHSLGQSALNHIRNRHGDAQTETSRGQLPVTEADIAQIPEIVSNYDAIRTDLRGHHGEPLVAFAKRTEDGVLLYLAAATKKRRNLGAVSMWRYPPAVDVQQVLESAVAPDHYAQSAMAAWADDTKPISESKPNGEDFYQNAHRKIDDAAYLDAVARGDMEAAQRMVNEAADAAGYSADSDFRMRHSAPNSQDDFSVSLANIRDADLVPADYWTHPQYYLTDPAEKAAWREVKSAFANFDRDPSATITVYRAVPKASKGAAMRNGDWVSPSRQYAQQHGISNLRGGFKVISEEVPLSQLYWDGNSIAELGFDNGKGYAYKDTKNNRKLLDAVTRDESGNIVPLSQRFNAKKSQEFYQQAWHGTPHRGIEQTGFKLNKIGTGEGAQAYGWGMYFASQREVSEGYRKALEFNDNEVQDEAEAFIDRADGSDRMAIADLLHAAKNTSLDPATRKLYEDAAQWIKDGKKKTNPGQLYSAEIPENDELLDWDKPLNEQPQKVLDALNLYINLQGYEHYTPEGHRAPVLVKRGISGDTTGQQLYNSALFGNTPQEKSDMLRSAGIPGLRYLDGNSRSRGEGSHNYVIWDEALLTPEKAKIQAYYQSAQRPTLDFAGCSFEDLAAEYAALPETAGGHIIDTDLVRELSPEYRADRTRAADIHEAASALTKQLYAAALARPVADGKDAAVLFLAGGGGSGKSFVRQSALGENTADITLDGTFSNLARAKSNIEAALASGREVRIVYVYRPPELAVQGVITRAIETGRPVPIDALAKAHAGAPEVVKAIAKLYDGDARVNILAFDNSGAMGEAKPSPVEKIPHVSEQNTLDTFASAFDRALESGQIPQRLYDASTRGRTSLGTKAAGRDQSGELSQSRGATGGDANASASRVSPGAAPLGSFNPDTFTITLLKGANLSTALHEGAHFFFENDLFIAGQISAEAQAFGYDGLSEGEKQILRDASALLNWHGIEGDIHEQLNRWHSLDPEAIRAYHERTAESFERYLLEGKAPSLELQSYFSKFRAWMLSVYSSLKNLLVQNPQAGALNPEVRGVFDRMLATNEEIALAQQARGMMAMFDDASAANMQPAEFAAYQALGKEATNAAIEQMQAKGLKDMAWLHRTKSKAIKRLGKDAAQLRAQYRNEAARQIMGLPVYQAWQFLTRKISAEDKLGAAPSTAKSASLDPSVDSFIEAIAKLGGINEAEAKRLYGVSRKEYPVKDPAFGKPVIRKKGGLGVDALSETLAENGYLPKNEHGQFDAADFEERFMATLGGDPQHSIYYNYDAANPRAGDQVPNPMALGAGRMDIAELRAWPNLSPDDLGKLQSMGMTAKNGLHPDIVTDIVSGFGSGDEMLHAILQAKDPHAAIEELVDARMLMEHGELSTPEAIDKAADAAVFNEARLKFAAAEANALAKATGQRSVLLAAAKQFAAERIARSAIRNILPSQYAAASARAAKEAQAASKRGDTAGAAAQKRNEVMHSVSTKAAYDALAEVDKAVSYFKRVLQSPSIATSTKTQIEALLAKYDLRTGQSLKAIDRTEGLHAFVMGQLKDGNLPDISPDLLPSEERAAYFSATATLDADGDYIYADDAKRIELLAGMIDASAKTHYKNLTMEQLRGLRETVEQLEHTGRLKDKLLTAKDQRSLNETKQRIADSITENARTDGQMQPTRDDLPSSALRGIKRFFGNHIRMTTKALVMDGGKDGGAMWEHFILPLNEAFDQETTMTADITAKLSDILAPVLKDIPIKDRMGKGRVYAEAGGATLNWGNRFAILLNMGNESNMQRLLAGGVGGRSNLTAGQIMPILSEFSAHELRAAQQVWDLFESLRPQVAELERLTKGKEPQWIPARPLTVRSKEGESVTLRGGYFPVVYDPQMSIKAAENISAEDANATKRAARAASTTRQSFTKQRVEEVHGRPLLLTLDGLYRGLSDVLHDLAFRPYAIDSSRLLRSKRITEAMAEHYGMDRVTELREFVRDMVAGQQGGINFGSKAAALARQNVAMSGLGLNIMNWLQQPFGISNSIIRLGGGKEGAQWLARGLMIYFNNPAAATRAAKEQSAFMLDRSRTRFRELSEVRNKVQVESPRQKAAPYLMSGMIWMQQIADTITWHAALEKATAEHPTMPEDRARAIADQVVRDSQGSGHDVDLSRIERGDEVQKLFTVFFNFMNTGNNLAYLSAKTGRGKVTATTDMLLAFVFPTLLSTILSAALVPKADGGGDDGEELKKFGVGVLSYLLSGIFMGREAQAAVQALFGVGYGRNYSGPTGMRTFADATTFATQVRQGEIDDPFRKAAINLGGSLFGLPSAQLNRSWTGAEALKDGETRNPAALVFGFQKQ